MNSHHIGINDLKGFETSHHQPLEFHIDVTILLRTEASLLGVKRLIVVMSLFVDIVKVDPSLVPKISKRHFLRDVKKSFQEDTPMGPEPHQFFSF